MASRCTTAFVEPLSAASTLSALAKAGGVSISRGERPSVAKATARRPVETPSRRRWLETAGGVAVPGSISPRVSATQAMVEAVPMTMQVPAVGHRLCLTAAISSASSAPARCCAQ